MKPIKDITTLKDLPGDQQVARYTLAVHQFALRLFQARKFSNAEDAADEITQDIGMKLFTGKLFPWQGTGKFRHYLIQMVRNEVSDYLRKHTRTLRRVALVEL